MATTMKSLTVYYESSILKTKIEDIPIPVPGPKEVLIKVHYAGSNPKDWKHPLSHFYNNAVNQGDDCSGTISALGPGVKSFQLNERVAGFHRMDEPHDTYAEFAICPAHTVFRIPATMSYAEAATIPLVAYTAAVGLYRNLKLPAPWERRDPHAPDGTETIPLVINAASAAVGAFATKLAKSNPRISPIITTAGSSKEFVEGLGVDAVIDYRAPDVEEQIRTALHGKELHHVLDATNTLQSVKYLTSSLSPGSGSRYTCFAMLPPDQDSILKADSGIWHEITFVGDVHGQALIVDPDQEIKAGGEIFGRIMSQVFESMCEEGTLKGHPFEVNEKGLEGVLDVLMELKERKRGGNRKFVTRIASDD
ncbi:Trans-enoyl reductase fsr4 [Pseudocercospora fuligena]|uniref:Trans-enoyl reductase fsr4 n=1 Tax=Pseudocercospora fuligena TaxID=685502 RepID=A0A8H6VCE7_9PEZI|nr:Trans-enoyl reductase fsr4 [Pseudocercospora fuligena]